jgi:hypothetical protein
MSNLEGTILQAFPPQPLGKAAKELRRLAEAMGGSAELDQASAWTDVVELLLAGETGDLPGHIMFLDGDAWRALLPAWMVASLRSGAGDRSLRLLGSILAVLDPGFTPKAPDVISERISGLTPLQRAAVVGFVSWATQHPLLIADPQSKAEIARLQASWPQSALARRPAASSD